MPKTLLLADDSVTIQKVVGISFASEDIKITTVDNGDAAVAKARELVPDVILADVVMPGLSGYEVCETIKADPALRHIPVLLLTGTFEAFDEARATAAGAAGHVSKPFEAQTLVDRVHQLLAAAPAPSATTAAPASAGPRVAAAADEAADPGATTDAFDFFSDDDAPAEMNDLSDGPLDLEEPEGAFAFGEDDFSDVAVEPAPDRTIAIMPETPDIASEPDALDFSFDDDSPDPLDAPMNPVDLGHTTLLDPAAGADLDVSSSDLAVGFAKDSTVGTRGPAPTRPIASPAAFGEAGATPRASDAIDFSATDFEMPDAPATPAPEARPAAATAPPAPPAASAKPPPAPAPQPVAPPAPFAPLPRDPVMEALSRPATPPAGDGLARPFGALPEAPGPAAPESTPDLGDTLRAAAAPPVVPIEAEPMAEESFASPFDAEPMDAEPIDDDDVASDLPVADPVAREAFATPGLSSTDPVWGDDEPAAAMAEMEAVDAASLSPAMREELRDTLEKIAWDAFGQVAEKVVREAIEQIERAAWEVVPKLAETLIQEEIRRLKGGNDG